MKFTQDNQPIWMATSHIDFRKSIDGLCAIVQDQFDILPQEAVFIFYNRARNRVKILMWHTNGFMLIYKRFEAGKLFLKISDEQKVSLNPDQLNWLMLGVDWLTLSGENACEFNAFS